MLTSADICLHKEYMFQVWREYNNSIKSYESLKFCYIASFF